MGFETPKINSEEERIRNPNVAEVMARAEKEYQDLLRSEEVQLTPEEKAIVEEMSAKAGVRAEKNARGLLDFEGLISGMEVSEMTLNELKKVYGERAEEIADVILRQNQAVKRETFSIAVSDDIVEALRTLKTDKVDHSVFSRVVSTRSTIRSWQSVIRRQDVVDEYLTGRMGDNSYNYQPNFLHDKLAAVYEYEWARESALRELLYFSTLEPEKRREAIDTLNGNTWEWRAPHGYGYSDKDVEQNIKDAVKIGAGLKRILEAGSAKEAEIFKFANTEELTDEEKTELEGLLPMIEMNRALSPDVAEKVDVVVTQYGFIWNEKIGHYVPEKKE